MSGAGAILVVNVLIAGLLCSAFLVIALLDRRLVSARWFAAAYALGIVYVSGEALIPAFVDADAIVLMVTASFLGALTLLDIGLARRYRVPIPWTVLAGAVGVSLLAIAVSTTLPRETLARMYLYQTPFFAIQAIGAWIVMRGGMSRALDRLLAGFLALSAVHYLVKPLAALALGGPGARPQDYLDTPYALVSQASGTVFVVATALLLLGMLVADIVRDMAAKSETDALSGLLNRGGFEDRLNRHVEEQHANGLPLSLVICDLDLFKSVNDTYGHASGDRLIVTFARLLRDFSASHHVLGRIGGEEFAILLRGSNLPAARLLAESVRSAFAETAVDGFPAGRRFTASFGVAELGHGESVASLFSRTDAALYAAKQSGRDRVRVSRAAGEGGAGQLSIV